MKHFLRFVLILTSFTIALSAKEISTKEVIDKMIEAYGTKEKLLKANSYKQSWSAEFMTSNKSGFDNRVVELPNNLRVEIVYPDRKETRVLTKNLAKKIYGDREVEAKGPMLDAMKLQLMRLYNPLELKKRVDNITINENSNQYMLTLKDGDISMEYILSKKSYLVEKVIGRLHMGSQQMEFLTKYEDYKEINGVMVPHREIKFAGSTNTAVLTLKSMEFIE